MNYVSSANDYESNISEFVIFSYKIYRNSIII